LVRVGAFAGSILVCLVLGSCASTPSTIPEPLQIRAVVGQSANGCSATDTSDVPTADQPTTLLAPNAPPPGPCLQLGPALLSLSHVARIQTGRSPAGLVLVSVRLLPSDVPRFDAVVQESGNAQLAFVILGQVLSVPTATPELTQPDAMAGTVQIAGGLSTSDPRPGQIAKALDATVVSEPSSCPSLGPGSGSIKQCGTNGGGTFAGS